MRKYENNHTFAVRVGMFVLFEMMYVLPSRTDGNEKKAISKMMSRAKKVAGLFLMFMSGIIAKWV